MNWRNRVLAALRVPHEPSAPFGDQNVLTFRAAPSYFRYRVVIWSLGQLGFVAALLLYFDVLPWAVISWSRDFTVPAVAIGPIALSARTMAALFHLLEGIGLALYAAQVVASALILRLDFEQRWYLVSDRSLRIRQGLVRLQEKTMTFANVQHIGIRQNPLQRWLGIADVQVRTAGGGAKKEQEHKEDLHVAYLCGVANAEAIRDVIQDRLRLYRDAGLGDPDDSYPHSPSLLSAAETLRDEARLLRQYWTG